MSIGDLIFLSLVILALACLAVYMVVSLRRTWFSSDDGSDPRDKFYS